LPCYLWYILCDRSESRSCVMYHTGVVTIRRAKKDVKWALKTIKIGKIFIFYHLKLWQSWQVGPFSFIWISRNSNQKCIWQNFKFKFQFRTFENEHLLHQIESILQRTIKRTHIILKKLMGKKKENKDLLAVFKKHSYPKTCEILKL
jgi:hypothetical protein